MQGQQYSYHWLRYGVVELLYLDPVTGPESIAFLQGEDAIALYDELKELDGEWLDYAISQYGQEVI